MLSENFPRTFVADDVDQSPTGIIKNVISVTNRGQTVTIRPEVVSRTRLCGRFMWLPGLRRVPHRSPAQPHLLPAELQQVIQTGNEEEQSGYSLPKLALSADLHRDRFGRPSVFIGRTAVCLDKPLERSAHQLSAAGVFILNRYWKTDNGRPSH